MKKILIFILVFMLALATLASCTPDDSQGDNNQGNNDQGGNNDQDNDQGNNNDQGGSDNNDDTNHGGDGTAQTYTVYFKNNASWTSVNVYIWLTADETDTYFTEAWPGSAMTEGEDGWYSFSFECESTDGVKLIFNDGTNQTADLLFDAEKLWWANSVAYATKAEAEQSRFESVTVYYKNTAGWETPHFHAWTTAGAVNSWPGVPMTKVEGSDDWYSITCDVASLDGLGYLFGDGSGEGSAATGNQTSDIVYNSSKLYYAGGNLYASMEEAESDKVEYADLYIRGSHNNWGTDSRFTLDANGNSVITVTLSAGVQFKIANGNWSYDINYTNTVFQSDSNFDWGTDNNNVKVVTAGTYTFTVTPDGTLTIEKN